MLAPPNDESDTVRSTYKNACKMCAGECITICYTLIEDDAFVICQYCFHEGRYPHEISSRNFTCTYGPLAVPHAYPKEEWTDEETLKLLDAIEKSPEDWIKIAYEVGRAPIECQVHFLSFAGNKARYNNVYEIFLSTFVKEGDNPVTILINLLCNAAHPSLGAQVAKTALAVILSNQPTNIIDLNDATHKACEAGFNSAWKLAEECVLNDIPTTTIQLQRLLKLQQDRIRTKLLLLKQIQHSQASPDCERSMLGRMMSSE
jgi:Myb-like DNA-binding domain